MTRPKHSRICASRVSSSLDLDIVGRPKDHLPSLPCCPLLTVGRVLNSFERSFMGVFCLDPKTTSLMDPRTASRCFPTHEATRFAPCDAVLSCSLTVLGSRGSC